MQISELRFRLDRIDLAHVPSLVFLLHVVYVQEPRPMLIVRDTYPRIPRYHVVVDGQNRRLLEVHPRDLQKQKRKTVYVQHAQLQRQKLNWTARRF